ncbi:hypothetical protein [Mycobacterium sp. OTB74]|jgi:hypothetical protein|uniref:hypothetical protein n=1 Tax=Mycobacterium sp. OTB74 TaxID=1853452 RepID=UPI00247667FD|nr:hypothetical protein [Mycobacterium sp. OTB74]MDH6242648.1 hypothetical protein [Mycobacterium sp. OTB74]
MPYITRYELSGDRVQLSYSDADATLKISFDDTSPALRGTHEFAGTDIVQSGRDKFGSQITATVRRMLEPHNEVRFKITLYLPDAGPADSEQPATDVPVTAALVLTHSPWHRDDLPQVGEMLSTYTVETLTGTLTRSAVDASAGPGGQ